MGFRIIVEKTSLVSRKFDAWPKTVLLSSLWFRETQGLDTADLAEELKPHLSVGGTIQ